MVEGVQQSFGDAVGNIGIAERNFTFSLARAKAVTNLLHSVSRGLWAWSLATNVVYPLRETYKFQNIGNFPTSMSVPGIALGQPSYQRALHSMWVHSIFVLRLFNDGVAMWLLYLAIYLFLLDRWRLGCVSYSLAVGVKMNILLFAPGLLLLLVQANGVVGTAVCLSICAGVQLLLGAPFLLHHPVAYIARSFELGRVFKFEWTVNFKFLSEEIFVSPVLSVVLLTLTVATLGLFAFKWMRSCPPPLATFDRRVGKTRGEVEPSGVDGVWIGRQLSQEYMVKTLFVSNFIGVVFCRSLHYQFYCWYYHTLPFLLWQTNYPVVVRLAVLVGTEFAFNIFPATPASSALLQVCHVVLFVGLLKAPVALTRPSPSKSDGKDQ